MVCGRGSGRSQLKSVSETDRAWLCGHAKVSLLNSADYQEYPDRKVGTRTCARSSAFCGLFCPRQSFHSKRFGLNLYKNHREPRLSPTGGAQILLYPSNNLSRSSVTPTSSNGHSGGLRAVPRQWWFTWLEGHTRGIAPLVVHTSKSQARPPGRRPLWPTQTHLLHPMAAQWSKWTEGVLS